LDTKNEDLVVVESARKYGQHEFVAKALKGTPSVLSPKAQAIRTALYDRHLAESPDRIYRIFEGTPELEGRLPSARDEGYEVRRFVTPRCPAWAEASKETGNAEVHARRTALVADVDATQSNILRPDEVLLHVYNMTKVSGGVFSGLLSTLGMGMYHVGVQVYGKEWTFNPRGGKYAGGVVMQEPGMHPMYSHYEAVSLGCTTLSEAETRAALHQLEKDWGIESHDEFRRNSVTFAEELCSELRVRPPPAYVSALTRGCLAKLFT
jgi:hypothetical protein